MKIAMVTETWRPHIDGVITRLNATISELSACGHEILLVAPTQDPAEIPGVRQEVIRHAVIPLIDSQRPWGLPDRRTTELIKAFDPDVVHLISPVLMGAAASRRLSGRYPVVASFHTDIAAYASRYGLAVLRPVLDRLTLSTYRAAEVCLATSPTGRRRLAEVGIDEDSVMLWPPGIDNTFTAPTATHSATATATTAATTAATRAASGQPPTTTAQPVGDRVSVLYVGRLAREKSCDMLLAAAQQAPRSNPPWHLTFVGDGPDRRRLQRRFSRTPTRFAGILHGTELIDAYREADVIVFPSTTDTVGLVLLEASALGRPIVAVDTPASRDTLGDYPRATFIAATSSAEQWRHALIATAATASLTAENPTSWQQPISWKKATSWLLDAYGRAIIQHRCQPGRPRLEVDGPGVRSSQPR